MSQPSDAIRPTSVIKTFSGRENFRGIVHPAEIGAGLQIPGVWRCPVPCAKVIVVASKRYTRGVPGLDCRIVVAASAARQDNAFEMAALESLTLKLFLKCLFGFIFLFMMVMTVRTSMEVPVWRASFGGNPWAWATLYDAYFGFITFFCWVAWRERSVAVKVIWLLLILLLGNIAMSLYVLIQLFSLTPEEPVGALFRPKAA
jgi:Protein of unknown function (DUF1475)